MAKFVIDKIIDVEDNPFDRQERIAWWSQEKLRNAKVMVVGSGAIGNETLKNLALLGVGNIFIVDFDTISTSNLSRTVLFRRSDKGEKKSEIAAKRTQELCLVEDARIDWFHGDIVWELGTGVYREFNIVLGCLDNVETRFAVNQQCWLAGTPWIDSGIYELGAHVSVFFPPEPPCYQCAATKEQIIAKRQRYSCDDFKKTMLKEGKMPTVQVASAFVSSIQVQEAVKIICGQEASIGKKIYFQGKRNDFDILQLQVNHECEAHMLSYPEVTSLSLSSEETVNAFLQMITQEQYSGKGACLDFRGGDRNFIVSTSCRTCGNRIEFFRPSFRIYDTETICSKCQQKGISMDSVDINKPIEKVMLYEFCLEETEERVLNMSLRDIGVPFLHIVTVRDIQGNYQYYELTGDRRIIFPNITR